MLKTITARAPEAPDLLTFRAGNILGTQHVPVEVARSRLVSDVTKSIIDKMALPTDVSWALRDDGSSAYLDDEKPIGDQLAPGASATVTPRAHLGACPGLRA